MAVFTTIDDAGLFYNTLLYTGTGSSNAVTGVGFSPNMTWIKARDNTTSHYLFDTARGATKGIFPDGTWEEATNVEYLNAFDADGFTVGTNTAVNNSTTLYASWNWKAATTTGIDTTGSTITPSAYTFDATSKVSAIAYSGNSVSGATLPHGLGVQPDMVVVKRLNTAGTQWINPFIAMQADFESALHWDAQSVQEDLSSFFNDTAPTAVNVVLGNDNVTNSTGNTYIAYCFAAVQGYSKFGKYTGNGNADGPFVYTGFRPAYFFVKAADSLDSWVLYDNKRLGYNEENDYFRIESTAAESSNTPADILSNGFKIRYQYGETNASGGDYVYAAFAESPLVNSESVPTNAR